MMKILLILMAVASLTMANYVQADDVSPDFENWTTKSLQTIFGAPAIITRVHGKIKTVAFPAGPHGEFHGPDCFGLILSFLRGPNADPPSEGDVDYGETIWKDHETGYTITMDYCYDLNRPETRPGITWHFTVTKNDTTPLTAELVDSEDIGPKLILHIKR